MRFIKTFQFFKPFCHPRNSLSRDNHTLTRKIIFAISLLFLLVGCIIVPLALSYGPGHAMEPNNAPVFAWDKNSEISWENMKFTNHKDL